jgi:hypothetical protein
MLDPLVLVLLFGAGTMAGIINIMSGGGSMLTLPTLIFVGLDSVTANGTNRVAIVMQNIFAVAGFRQQKLHDFRLSFKLALFALPGAILGAQVAVELDDAWFRRILAVVLVISTTTLFLPRPARSETRNSDDESDKPNDSSKQSRWAWLIYPALFAIGFYGGFIQVGVGFLFMVVLYNLLRLSLVYVNVHKVFIILIYLLPALAIFVWNGKVDWALGLSLGVGNATGGFLGTRLAVKGGDRWIRAFTAIVVLVMATRLLATQ